MDLARRTVTLLASIAAVSSGCSAIPADGVARGEVLFQNCSQCHGADGRGDSLVPAPQIAGLPAWYVSAQLTHFQGGIRGAHQDDVAGLKMRPMSRTLKSAKDVEAVAAYVASLPYDKPGATVAGGDSTKGQAAFATCTACHGADGAGNETLKAPPIRQLEDWYIVSQLGKFKDGIRGYSPADIPGAQMRGIAQGISDEVAMRDLAAYIHTLPAK